MSSLHFNSKSPTIKRILREAAELSTTPSPDYTASPASDSNLFDWHFTLRGPPSSSFEKGIYHGRIVLPPTYPLRPPSFRFLTPSGRFETNREICLSISGHHEETWQPAWGIRTALVALRSFMETDAKGQLGGLDTPKEVREKTALESCSWTCPSCARSNGDILKECEEVIRDKEKSGILDMARRDEEIAKELKLSLKDDFHRERAAAAGTTSHDTASGDSDADLVEGFTPSATNSAGAMTPPIVSSTMYPPARPAQSVPLPTGSVTNRVPHGQPQLQPQPREINVNLAATAGLPRANNGRISNDGVPVWIDRAIAGVVACLIVMLLKMLIAV